MGYTPGTLLAPGCNNDIALSTDLVGFIAIPNAWFRNYPYIIDGVRFIYVAFYIIALRSSFYR